MEEQIATIKRESTVVMWFPNANTAAIPAKNSCKRESRPSER